MMLPEENYLSVNRDTWNQKAQVHFHSEFYDVEGFKKGTTSLKEIELDLLGDVTGKKILHLQCHFGQDTLSLARMGASVTGIDLSDVAIELAKKLSVDTGIPAQFVCSDVYDLPCHLKGEFDIVFTTYGTIGWLPDLTKWAMVISHFLREGGTFVFAEFHPVVWMFNDDFNAVTYNYFNEKAIIEEETGTYADRQAAIRNSTVSWNHSISEVVNALIDCGLTIERFNEYDYSPYDCFAHTEESEPGKFRISHLGNRIPMVYSLRAVKH